jgi:hypothetical protein
MREGARVDIYGPETKKRFGILGLGELPKSVE